MAQGHTKLLCITMTFQRNRRGSDALHSGMSLSAKVGGQAPGTLAYPTGVAVDNQDRIVVADWLADSVQVRGMRTISQ